MIMSAAAAQRSRRSSFSLQKTLTGSIDLKNHSIGSLINGRGSVQEPALLLLVRMSDPIEGSESELHRLASLQRRGHFSENGIKNADRFSARQTHFP
jgi:hypothetical protein